MSTAAQAKFRGFIGRTERDGDRVFVTIDLSRGYVSITGETYAAGRKLTGDISSGGQIIDTFQDVYMFGDLASHLADHEDEVASLLAFWYRRHLGPLTGFTVERARAFGHLIEAGDPDEAEDEIATLTDEQAEDQYAEWLNELDEVKIGVLTFGAGDVLRKMDPIAFREGMNDWLNMEGLEVE